MSERGAAAGPAVSVIIPTYNWSSVLRYALQSVLWQSFQDFEVRVVGDACTDDSAEVVAAFGDERVHWHNLAVNSGSQPAPNNAGLRMARGRYVAYLGHDDVWYPTHLGTVVAAIERSDADLAHGLTVMIGPPGSGARILAGIPPDGEDRPLVVPPSSILHRRELIEQIGPWREDYRNLTLGCDQEFVERAWAHRQRFVSGGQLTVFKFPATWRPNSYRERRSDEQAEYVRRIGAEPDFMIHELLAIARAYAARTTGVDWGVANDIRPGWIAEMNRFVRGLDDTPPPAAVEELFRLRSRESELLTLVQKQTAWAQRLDGEVAARDARIQALQGQVTEQTAWARRLADEVTARDATIRALQGQVAQQTAWAQRLVADVALRDATIQALQAQAERSQPVSIGIDGSVAHSESDAS